METELEELRQEMLGVFDMMESDSPALYRTAACQSVRDCLRRAHELGFSVTIRFFHGRREIEFVKTEENDQKQVLSA